MIVSPAFAGKRYVVLGLARSGLATVRSLVESGAAVTAWDGKPEARLALPPGVVVADPMTIDLAGFDGIVVSPGVPLNTHPIAERAREAGVPVIGDIELFAQARSSLPAHKVVGITGTNGKSTVTALIHHILTTAAVPATMGGNIGLPILAQEPLPEGGVYVLELSSFQIDLTHSLDCDVAVLTNITPDHLDRYDGFEQYAASKMRLFEMQSSGHIAVLHFAEEARISREVDVVWLFERVSLNDQPNWPALQGPHNSMNAQAAMAVAQGLGILPQAVQEALRTYPGLPHRMERVSEIDGVLYVNDSKATNATSAAPALGAYPKIHWILGGRRKTDELDACRPFYSHVVAAYTIGESAELFADILRNAGIAVLNSGTLQTAVKQAAQIARRGETVLLSPACASYDQFTDYEARGDAFRGAVASLGGALGGRP
ncbi:MAG: UDP-N-acetylmuramoylalanine--D-glutamate ligase [Sphingomonas bacterium]|nr:UDP-N-acetylmuramoylalanine--D-glutamate ligase [Sphingomonas bacterium]